MENSQKLIESKLREKKNKSLSTLHWRIVEPPTPTDWVVFTTLQLLDVYSTYRGLQYDCVRELNPIIGERPSIGDMVFVKTAVFVPALKYDKKQGNLSSRSIRQVNGLMFLVVGNNYNVLTDSQKNCKKR
jgi:hypothetical protein